VLAQAFGLLTGLITLVGFTLVASWARRLHVLGR
jgi:hypothetical protein